MYDRIGLPPLSSTLTEDYTAYVQAYVDEVRPLPFVEKVFADNSHGLSIFTVYRGSLFEIGIELMRAKGRAMDAAPRIPVDFSFIPADTEYGEKPTRASQLVLSR